MKYPIILTTHASPAKLSNSMWVKQCHKPAMTGNGKHSTYHNGDFPGGWCKCFTHVITNDPNKMTQLFEEFSHIDGIGISDDIYNFPTFPYSQHLSQMSRYEVGKKNTTVKPTSFLPRWESLGFEPFFVPRAPLIPEEDLELERLGLLGHGLVRVKPWWQSWVSSKIRRSMTYFVYIYIYK